MKHDPEPEPVRKEHSVEAPAPADVRDQPVDPSFNTGRSRGKGVRDVVIIAALVVVGFGAVAAAGFYQDELRSFFRLQGWDMRPVTEATRQFLQAAAREDGDRVAAMLAPGAQTIETVQEDGRVTGVKVADYGGPRTVPLKELAPSENPEISAPTLVAVDGGSVSLVARFPGSHSLQMLWDRSPDGWKVKDIGWVAGGG